MFLFRKKINHNSDAFGVAFGVAFSVAFSITVIIAGVVTNDIADGVISFVAFNVAVVVAFSVAFGITGSVAVVVAFGAADIVASGVAAGVTGSIVVVVAGIVAGGVAGGVAGVSKLTLLFYLIASSIIALGFAPTKNHRWALALTLIMLLLGFENLQASVLWAIPSILLCYYRIFPDYLLSTLPTVLHLSPTILPIWLNRTQNLLSILKTLPRLNSELIWLPIPYHDILLAAAFQQSPAAALKIYQTLQTAPLPGAQITLFKALPNILANCLKAPTTTANLLQTQTANHPQLPILIPEYYQQSTDEASEDFTPVNRQPEIAIIFPRLQTFLANLSATLDTPSIPLRERGLESLQTQLTQLQLQLPSLLPPRSVSRWQSVLTHWQTLLELELQDQRKLSQGELLSPFQFGNPLKPRDTFKGRRTLADRLYRLILDRNRPTLVLHGPRRFGKTSFLNNLPRLLPSDLIPIYLDLQSSALSSSESDFCYGLIRAILRDTRSQPFTLPAIPSRDSFTANPYPTLEDWLDQALPKIPPGQRLLLNLDEFEKIGTAITDGKLTINLLNELRHLIQHRDELAFMFSGVQTLEELGPNWSSYFISVVPIEMLYLEPHEAEDLLRNPDPDFKMRYEDGLIETILHLTHCQPYLLQLIGACLVDQANRAQVKTATHKLLTLAIPEAFTNGSPYFTNLWQEFTGTTPQEIAAGQQILRDLAHHHQANLTSPTAQAAHRRLRRFHLIETLENNTDRIEIPLIEQWVRDRAIDL